ncbi:hypothetical protein BH24DEI2_BH24DEI2_18670 [soil metagenome]
MPVAARVLLPLPLPAFSYLTPFGTPAPAVGCRVAVPWQGGLRLGLVAGVEEVPASKALELREFVGTLETTPFVLPNHMSFIDDLAAHTLAPPGRVLASLLPVGLADPLHHEVRLVAGAVLEEAEGTLQAWTDAATLKSSKLDLYRRQGLLLERVRAVQATVRVLKAVRAPDKALDGTAKAAQREALEALLDFEHVASAAEFARDEGLSESTVRTLVKKGYAEYADVPAPPPALPSYEARALPPTRPSAETACLAADRVSLSGGDRAARLAALLPLLKADLKAGRSVLVLVPEGVVLAETAAYLADAVPSQVLSGELSDAQRGRVWRELAAGDPVVLVGSYLALLAPLDNLGRIVVLEEGSSSYKLQSGPRLFVPSAARVLAERLKVPIVFSDALPTPETLHLVQDARVTLPRRGVRVHVADLAQERNWPLGADLVRVLKQVAARERQAVLLAPRRVFSAALGCAACGYLAMCPNCDLPLRYHQRQRFLKCHQCAYHTKPPDLCPECQATTLGPMRGAGTEWIVAEVRKHVGPLPVYRSDADQRDDLGPLLAGEAGIVVATTAILRHAPLPNVSLLAVTLLDTLLAASDFRAEEETLRFLLGLSELQPSKRPLTLLQTFQGEHALLSAFRDQDEGVVEAYLARLLERRRHYLYPPFVTLAKVQLSSKSKETAEHEAATLAKTLALRTEAGDEVLGPTPAPVARLRGMHTYQLFVRSSNNACLRRVLEPALSYGGRARLRVDVEPRDIGAYLD